jgi:hypothetical protein
LERIEAVTERGLKKGWSEFYVIFDAHYATISPTPDAPGHLSEQG